MRNLRSGELRRSGKRRGGPRHAGPAGTSRAGRPLDQIRPLRRLRHGPSDYPRSDQRRAASGRRGHRRHGGLQRRDRQPSRSAGLAGRAWPAGDAGYRRGGPARPVSRTWSGLRRETDRRLRHRRLGPACRPVAADSRPRRRATTVLHLGRWTGGFCLATRRHGRRRSKHASTRYPGSATLSATGLFLRPRQPARRCDQGRSRRMRHAGRPGRTYDNILALAPELARDRCGRSGNLRRPLSRGGLAAERGGRPHGPLP